MLRKLAAAFGFLVVLVLGAALYFSSSILYTGKYRCNEEHFVYCGDPASIGLPFENIEFRTADNVQIRGWWIPGTAPANAVSSRQGSAAPAGVVVVHGRGVDRHEGLRFAPPLHAAGFSLLYLDLRNCGESQRSFSSMGMYEQRDVHAAVDFMTGRGVKSTGVMGFSMGAATSIMAMSEDTRIRAGVFEGGFASFDSAVTDAAWTEYRIPRYPLIPLVEWIFSARIRMDPERIAPVRMIGTIAPRPVFIIHGTADTRVLPHNGDELYAAAKEPKWFWSVPGGRHTRAWQADRAQAEAKVTEFFVKYL